MSRSSLRLRIMNALDEIGLGSEDQDVLNERVHAVRSLFDVKDGKSPPARDLYGEHPPKKALMNLAILKLVAGLENREIGACLIKKPADVTKAFASSFEKKKKWIDRRASVYALAKSSFSDLSAELDKGRPLDQMDLMTALRTEEPSSRKIPPMGQFLEIEKLMKQADYQDGQPDAVCLAAEKLFFLGETALAESLIAQIREASPDHPGAYVLEARIALAKRRRASQAAAQAQRMSEDSEATSSTERHYEELAEMEQGDAEAALRRAFEAAAAALLFWPDPKLREKGAPWTGDWSRLRSLRENLIVFVLDTAGDALDPQRLSDQQDHVLARLGRLQKWDAPPNPAGSGDIARRRFGLTPDPERAKELCAQPIFSEDIDRLLPQLVEEASRIMGRSARWPASDLDHLNVLRVLGSRETYVAAIEEFIKAIRADFKPRSLHEGDYLAESRARVFGDIPDPARSPSLGAWRITLHEHLDAVMSRDEQHEVIKTIYERWEAEIRRRSATARASLMNDEIRRKWASGDLCGAYARACEGEAQGLYRRDEAYGALTLRRLAQRLLQLPDAPPDLLSKAQAHVQDGAMERVAETLSEDILNGDDYGCWPNRDFRGPLNDTP